ncbi:MULTISPECIES: high light inducible protein [unclassified Cyanobium]|uniref:high light inducible protein n=1 Tax=unclassified Cyanobium TaxID=2627006 RepID=UPI0037C194C6
MQAIIMKTPVKTQKKLHVTHFAESEGGMWGTDGSKLLDPKVIEARMSMASPGSDSGWGFHHRAELLNGRLAMLGIGLALEALTGSGILQQMGLGALLAQG